MSRGTVRPLGVVAIVAALVAPIALFAGTATAAAKKPDPVYKFNYKITATAHIAKLNQTMSPPPGVFKGSINLKTGALKGTIALPPASFTYEAAGAVPVTAVAAMVPTKPVTGHVDLKKLEISSTSTLNIQILTAYVANPALPTLPIPISIPGLPVKLPPLTPPPLLPAVNLVGDNCGTAIPISITMSGKANLKGPSTFSGTFSIPKFKTCELATPVLNQLIPGSGNTFSATAEPIPATPAK